MALEKPLRRRQDPGDAPSPAPAPVALRPGSESPATRDRQMVGFERHYTPMESERARVEQAFAEDRPREAAEAAEKEALRVAREPDPVTGAILSMYDKLRDKAQRYLPGPEEAMAAPRQTGPIRAPAPPTPEQLALYKELQGDSSLRRVSSGIGKQVRSWEQRERAQSILSDIEAAQFAAGHRPGDPNVSEGARAYLPRSKDDVAYSPFPNPTSYDEQLANERAERAHYESELRRIRRLASPENIPGPTDTSPLPIQATPPISGPEEDLTKHPESPADVEELRKPAKYRLGPSRRDSAYYGPSE